MLLENKNAVITGCNRGIGKEILRVFAENGSNIWACIRKESETFTEYITDLESKHSVRINTVYFDLNDEKQIKWWKTRRSKKTFTILKCVQTDIKLIFTR